MTRRAVILDGNPQVPPGATADGRALLAACGGNTGNLAFRFAVSAHLPEHVHLPWSAPVERIRAAGDVLVLPLANQLGPHTDLGEQADKILATGLPVIGLGLGAQAPDTRTPVVLTPGTRRWLRAILDRPPAAAPNLGLRGAFTEAQVRRFAAVPGIAVIGCPSNLIALDTDIAAAVAEGFRRPFARIAVTAGIAHVPALRGIEQALARLVTRTEGAYIVQHDLEMVQVARGEFDALAPEQVRRITDYVLPGATAAEFQAWARRHARVLAGIEAWMSCLRRFDFVTGTRFHGVMLALQAGVPAGCIAHDSRTQEMCVTMGVPVVEATQLAGPITPESLRAAFSFDPDRFRQARRSLAARYLGILDAAGLAVAPALRRLAA
ncbi:polysaccharide pyruvyl transferase family protein [Paracraurococcus lichenis]|uniref:Polysaccharide pyruvyl transferase family protein n=1 Tax=Paracraurococcus lichenis TaxID=3064888 RepID=A0ABT9E431_9PROT|nr:polysaccharide pyruvyl transferase family protein [Paracraurococcus sp. LOR1-02]MDO9710903.1 polysaccharide pyruvyl transferase family protein [Paracraurococcus sp. LOR1-02]